MTFVIVGIGCPDEESVSAVPGVAEALSEFCQVVPCGIIVVTIGEVGMIICDRQTIAHVGLTATARATVRTCLGAAQRNGLGDQTFAALVLGDQTYRGPLSSGTRMIHIARQAWV